MRSWGLLLWLFCTLGCSWRPSTQPSILVILVESLSFNTVSCREGSSTDHQSGFEILCQESVRFTHAYTSSNLSQSAIASLLTGRYPQDHGVWHNGPQFLSAKIETAAEVALKRGYRTSFFSGGPPVWRRSGLNQGFEVFDDVVQPTLRRLYRPVLENTEQFWSWWKSEGTQSPFFSVLYLPDLQFIDSPTANDLGEVRESSFQSQFEELDETLGTLFERMKKEKIWDPNYIFVVGLNGFLPEARYKELRALNVFSEDTRVALFIKPPRKTRDLGVNWKVDENVSLVDVGATLYELLKEAIPKLQQSDLQSISLAPALREPETSWPANRPILVESAWGEWRGYSTKRLGLRSGPYFYLHDFPGRFYDTLTDNLEISPLPISDTRYGPQRQNLHQYLLAQGFPPWVSPQDIVIEKLELAKDLWRQEFVSEEVLNRLIKLSDKYKNDTQLLGWRAIWALRRENWEELKRVSALQKDLLWAWVVARNQGQKMSKPNIPCLQSKQPSLRDCPNLEVIELLNWMNESLLESDRQKAMDTFYRLYLERTVLEKVAEHNYVVGLVWDVPVQKPDKPSLVDLILSLPENKKYKQMISKRLSGEYK